MHAITSTTSVRRVAATSALALVALSGTAATAVAAPGDPSTGAGARSGNAAPQADEPQGKAKGYGKSKGNKGNKDGKGNQGNKGAKGNQGGGSGGSQAPDSQGAPADQGDKGSTGSKGSKGSPPGNNGTVKIAPLGEMDGIPNNTPHVGCDFQIEWYGFDEGADVVSTVSFAMQAPTRDVGLTVDGPSEVFVGEDPASGAGQDPDGVQPYRLSFDGEPHPKQGYHVKLTISTPRSNGSDVKHKVFWVEDCEDGSTSSLTPPEGEESDSLTGPDADEDGTEAESGVSGDSTGSSDSDGMSGFSGSDSSSASDAASAADSDVAARSGVSQDVTTSGASDTPGSVDAGLSGSDIARGSLVGLLVAAAGGALLWYARRTRAHG